MLALRALKRHARIPRTSLSARPIASSAPSRSDALFVVRILIPQSLLLSPLIPSTLCSTVIPRTTTPKSASFSPPPLAFRSPNPSSASLRIHTRKPQPCPRNHLSLSSPVQEGRRYPPPRPRTAPKQGLDLHLRHELRRQTPRHALNACLRSGYLLHNVQPVCFHVPPPHPSFSHPLSSLSSRR